MSQEEILDGRRVGGVSHVRRLTTLRDGLRKGTNLLVLSFEASLSVMLLAGHIRYSARVTYHYPTPFAASTVNVSVTQANFVNGFLGVKGVARPP